MSTDKPNIPASPEAVSRLGISWRSLLDALPVMVFLFRDDGRIEYMNRSGRSCFGPTCSREAADGLKALWQSCVREVHEDARNSPEAGTCRVTQIETMTVEFVAVPFTGHDREPLLFLVLRDISRQQENRQELLQAKASLELLLQQKISALQACAEQCTRLTHQTSGLKSQLVHHQYVHQMIGSSNKMRELREMILQVSSSDATVLITGESGTGKELVANLLQAASSRADKPYLKVDCKGLSDVLLEAELFGAAPDQEADTPGQIGKFEIVNGGTLFLDKISVLSPRMQVALLRVLQHGEIMPLGRTEPVEVNVRVIAATNTDLEQLVAKKQFRLDLYYRLRLINIRIPPLRERREDLVELAGYFVNQAQQQYGKKVDFLPQTLLPRLLAHDWPGNVRELENLMQRAVLMAREPQLTGEDLVFVQEMQNEAPLPGDPFRLEEKLGVLPLKNMVAEFEADIIRRILTRFKGNVAAAAMQLGIGKTALYDKMKSYGISAKQIKHEGGV